MLDVYDFKGKGVAMSMYNTDEVNSPGPTVLGVRAEFWGFIVDYGLRAFVFQDGFAEEDAAGKSRLENVKPLPDFFSHPLVPFNQKHDHEEV